MESNRSASLIGSIWKKTRKKSEGLQGETLLYLSHLAFLFPVNNLKVVEQKWINQAMPTKADLDVSKLAIWLILIEYKIGTVTEYRQLKF